MRLDVAGGPGLGGGGEGEGAAVEDVLAALPGDQRVERAEGASFAGEDQVVGRGAFAQPVPGWQLHPLAEARGVRVAAGEPVRDALVAAMAGLPAQLRRSLTWDRGKEMALHDQIAAALGMPVFFCDPHSPWQRPTNENTNGLLRQYFPKGSDLRVHGPGRLAAVAAELNDRPRKTLGWNTPAALLAAALERHADR